MTPAQMEPIILNSEPVDPRVKYKPQLAAGAELSLLPKAVTSDKVSAEQKIDGDRILAHVVNGEVTYITRNGKVRAKGMPRAVTEWFATFGGDWVFDGEIIDGTVLWIFDMPLSPSIQPSHRWIDRRRALESVFDSRHASEVVRLLPTAVDLDDKQRLVTETYTGGGEGIILKRTDSPYRWGARPSAWRKFKFVSDCDCVVMKTKVQGKDNMVLGLYTDTKPRGLPLKTLIHEHGNGWLIEIAHCTALSGDGTSITDGDVVTVQYLYATDGNRLYQPTLPRIRTDKAPTECTFNQLRYGHKGVIA